MENMSLKREINTREEHVLKRLGRIMLQCIGFSYHVLIGKNEKNINEHSLM
jgi:hypothetical protein